MRNKVILVLSIFIIVLLGLSYYLYNNTVAIREDLNRSINNEKAYISQNDSLINENLVFQKTIDELYYEKDSLFLETGDLRRKLGIKDKEIKQLQYITSTAQKVDTIVFNDTIFIDPSLDLDTIVGDKWYQIDIKLKYPNILVTAPKFKSEKIVIVNYKLETVRPPNKCWLVRLFQRKHKVVEVNIEEKNPYITSDKNKFIEIVK